VYYKNITNTSEVTRQTNDRVFREKNKTIGKDILKYQSDLWRWWVEWR